MTLNELLLTMVEKQASDLYLQVGVVPSYRINGETQSFHVDLVTAKTMKDFLEECTTDLQQETFEREKELNLSYTLKSLEEERFRCNIYQQKGHTAMVFRHVLANIPTIKDLGVDESVLDLAMLNHGLVLVTGPTGAGKSSTMAAMIHHRAQNASGHIVTIEDPIEYYLQSSKSLVSQRELSVDTLSYTAAMKSALRQAPDVLLVGELRDRESVEMAMNFAETGHLVIATLHVTNATQTIQRLLQYFDEDEMDMVCLRLSLSLMGVISQRLLSKKDGSGRVLAMEMMRLTPTIGDLIRKQELVGLKKAMLRAEERGMITLDQSLMALYNKGVIDSDTALAHADSANNMRLEMQGVHDGTITLD